MSIAKNVWVFRLRRLEGVLPNFDGLLIFLKVGYGAGFKFGVLIFENAFRFMSIGIIPVFNHDNGIMFIL